MSTSRDSQNFDLALLAKRLLTEGMPVQAVIAAEVGVSQPTVSRAARGLIKYCSPSARKLWDYAAARAELLSLGAVSGDHVTADAAADGMGATSSRGKASTGVRRSHHAAKRPAVDGDHQALASAALKGLQHYLDDAFDPRLVIEQLAVLRRAQDPGRSRRQRTAGRWSRP